MSVRTQVASFLVGLVVLFGAAFLLGGAVDPVVGESGSEVAAPTAHEAMPSDDEPATTDQDKHGNGNADGS